MIFQRSRSGRSKPDYFRAISPAHQWLLQHVPYYAAWYRFRTFYTSADGLHASVQLDPSWPHPERSLNADNDRVRGWLVEHIQRELGERSDLVAKCVPDYPPFAKRMLLDNGWYRTLTKDNVELVIDDIARVTETASSCETAHGTHSTCWSLRPAFKRRAFCADDDLGAGGKTLQEMWSGDPRAHLGITVPGFPNLFVLYGPNTNLAHGGSIVFTASASGTSRVAAHALRRRLRRARLQARGLRWPRTRVSTRQRAWPGRSRAQRTGTAARAAGSPRPHPTGSSTTGR